MGNNSRVLTFDSFRLCFFYEEKEGRRATQDIDDNKRAEVKLSNHRPVIATYMVEVHTFSPRKLQRALTFTHAEIENEQVITNYTKHKTWSDP